MPGGKAFGSNRTTSTWNKNRVDPFYGYGQLETTGMKGLKEGEAYGQQNFGSALAAQNRSLAGYEAMAAGQGPSLAQEMMRRQTAQSIAAQQSMGAQAGGAGAFRNAAWQGASQAAAGNQAISELRAQEQQAAMQGAAGMSSQMAGQGLQQQLGYAGMLNQAQISQMQAAADFELQQRALQEQERMGRMQRRMGWANFGVSTGGKVAEAISSAVSASDERLKTGIAPGQTAASELAGAAAPIEFDYQPGAGPGGRRVGVSAQQLEQTPAGRALVIDTPGGKMVDTGQAALAGLAISGDQEQRLRALEQRAPAGMEGATRMATGPQIAQPRSQPVSGGATELQNEAVAARERLAATSAAIDELRAQTGIAPAAPPQRYGPGTVDSTRHAVGSEIDRMQAEFDAGNPFGVPGGSKVGSQGSTSVNTGQIMGGGGGGGGGGMGSMMGGMLGGMMGGGGGAGAGGAKGGGGFGGGMKAFGGSFSDERRKRAISYGGASASALAGSLGRGF